MMRSRFPRTMPRAVELLGRGSRARRRVRPAQPDDGQPGPDVGDVDGRRRQHAGVVQGRRATSIAAYFPAPNPSNRQASFYDPKTGKFELIYTCFGTHHLQFGEDAGRCSTSAAAARRSRGSTSRSATQTKDEKQSAGLVPDRARHQRRRQDHQAVERAGRRRPLAGRRRRRRTARQLRSEARHARQRRQLRHHRQPDRRLGVERRARAIRAASSGSSSARIRPRPAWRDLHGSRRQGQMHFGPRGIDVDRNGVVWTALSGSGGFVSFDRRKCKVFNGPSVVDGKQCAEGWTFYPLNEGPEPEGHEHQRRLPLLQLGRSVQHVGLRREHADRERLRLRFAARCSTRRRASGRTLRVPYPLGFYSRGLDGRIDDPNAGWKGRGLWANYGTNFLWHIEGGQGHEEQDGPVPGAARSAGSIATRTQRKQRAQRRRAQRRPRQV